MSPLFVSRRRFNEWLVAGLMGAAGIARANPAPDAGPSLAQEPMRLRVAAIQMVPVLGDLRGNLAQAERLVRKAIAEGAQWIILPEMFTTAAAFHPDLLAAIQPTDGLPYQLLRDLSAESGTVVGGSFLAERDGRVFNSFVLFFPSGSHMQHDKDLPTYWENCFYQGGTDEGVLETPIGPVGSALCWEIIRSSTAKRLLGKVRLLVGGSCWWTLPDDADPASPLWAANLKMLQEAPPRLARLLGVPFIHGSHAGRFEAFFSPDLPDVPYNSSYLGEGMIVDSGGTVLARRGRDEGEGVVLAEVTLPEDPAPAHAIPDRFWMPEEMPEPWKESWERWLETGRHYYDSVTLPYLHTGEFREYVPEYLSDRAPHRYAASLGNRIR